VSGKPLEEVRRRAGIVETLIEAVCLSSVKRTCRFYPRAARLASGFFGRAHERPADAASTLRFIHNEGSDPAPRGAVMGYRHEKDVCDPHRCASLSVFGDD